MSLNLDYHLLETQDDLVTALFWYLVLEVVVGALAILAELLFLVLVKATGEVVLEVLGASFATLLSGILIVDTLCIVLSMILCIGSGVLNVLLAQRQSVLEVGLHALDIRLLVPGVVFGMLVDLIELFFRWVDLAGCLGGCITSDVAEQNGSIVHWSRVSAQTLRDQG